MLHLDKNGKDILHHAVLWCAPYNILKTCKLLLTAGADPNVILEGQSSLQMALIRLDIVKSYDELVDLFFIKSVHSNNIF